MEVLEKARRDLMDVLRDKSNNYWDLLKMWYKRKISKDDFDYKAKEILGEEGTHLHNEFLFAILVKCLTPISSVDTSSHIIDIDRHTPNVRTSDVVVKKPKLDIPHHSALPYGYLNDFTYDTPNQMSYSKDLDNLLLCSHELLLPDFSTLHVRMLLIAWECGLELVNEETVSYVMMALEYFLKNVISACSYNSRGVSSSHISDGVSRHSIETSVSHVLQVEASNAQHVSRHQEDHSMQIITPFHLRDVLLYNGTSCVPNHFISCCITEKTIATLWHPSKREILDKQTVEQWQRHLV
jgi:transcriptional adapter 1